MGRLLRGLELVDEPRTRDFPVALHGSYRFLTALGSDPRARKRLRTEVRLARQVSHPNVCRVYDIGEAHGELYLSARNLGFPRLDRFAAPVAFRA